MTQEVCERVGWRYQVFTGLTPTRQANLTFLAGFRQNRFAPGHEVTPQIAAAFTPPTSFAAGIRRAARATGVSKNRVRAGALQGSMGHVAYAGDNAAMESWHALLQKNVLDRQRWATREELLDAIVFRIERTYNRRRHQRALGKLTPR